MEAIYSFETSLEFGRTAQRYSPEGTTCVLGGVLWDTPAKAASVQSCRRLIARPALNIKFPQTMTAIVTPLCHILLGLYSLRRH
jgi:hypothetical protein